MPVTPANTLTGSSQRIGASWRASICPPLMLFVTIATLTVRMAQAANGLAPVITASVNESVRVELCRGWPLVLEVSLLHPQPFAPNPQPLLIDLGAGPWSDAVRIQILDAAGQTHIWPLSLFNLTSNSLVLDGDTAGQLVYTLTPEQTASLDPGSYSIGARLTTTNSTDLLAWKGVARSVPVELAVVDEPPILTPEEREARQHALASYHLFRDDVSQANAAIDALLASMPDSIAGLSFKSYLLQIEERNFEAEQLLSSAVEIVYASFPNAREPPVELLRRRNELRKLPGPIVIRSIVLEGQSLTLVWDSNPGEQYGVESSADLKTWQPLAGGLTADSGIYLWTGPAGTEARFLRVRK